MQLATLLMGEPILEFIRSERANGKPWLEIRDAICDRTNGQVDVTWQAVQGWYRAARVDVSTEDAA